MGNKKLLGRIFKNQKKDKQKELQNRANQFIAEYSVIRARYRCDLQSYLELVNGGESGMKPKIRIIDVTKQVEEEEATEKLKVEAKEKEEKQNREKK